MKIIDYGIVEGEPVAFANLMREKIKEGWQPQGSMAVVELPGSGSWSNKPPELKLQYIQPVVKYDNIPAKVSVVGEVTTRKGWEG